MKFIANLRAETLAAFADIQQQPAAYLLSSHRVTPATLERARLVRSLGLPLFADNGSKRLIEATVAAFGDAAAELQLAVKAIRRRLGRTPRGMDIPPALRQAANALATRVVADATARSNAIDPEALLHTQLSMAPTDLLAQEDFATGCLVALDLEREITGWPVARFDTRVRRSLRLWRRIRSDPACRDIAVYAVLSAMDYNTARSAARLAADAEVSHAAVGIAGINLDSSAIDHYVMGSASLRLDKPAPRRYVRLAQIVRGIADGYRDRGRTLLSFHCLGLGAPSMFPIPAAALDGHTAVVADATSPIHDAVRDRVMYDPSAHGNRATTLGIVQRILAGATWPFVSPFSQAFRAEFGHDPNAARLWWQAHGHPDLRDSHLETRSELTDSMPLFAEADPRIRREAEHARIAHNHWVLGAIAHALRDGPARRGLALAAFDSWLAGPATVTTRGLAAARAVIQR